MKTIKKEHIIGQFIDEIPDILKYGIIYISFKYKTSSHLCLCGCGNLSVTPLNENGWTIDNDVMDRITLNPSILNQNCPNKSHYIITKNVANFV
jgi:hypothetical protein